MGFYHPDLADLAELQVERRAIRHVNRQLLDHPDPQDPDCPELPNDDQPENET